MAMYRNERWTLTVRIVRIAILSASMSSTTPPSTRPDRLNPPEVEEVLPWRSMLSLGLQHVLVIYAGLVAVPLILGSALGLDNSEVVILINCNLIIGGLATVLQTIGIWRFGARLPLIQGASFIALAPMLLIGEDYGIRYIFGSVIAAGVLGMILAPFFSRLLRFFPRVVIGCLITIVGISLMPTAAGWFGGGEDADDFEATKYLILGTATVLVTVIGYVMFTGPLASLSVLIGMVVGTVVALCMGLTDLSGVADADWIGIRPAALRQSAVQHVAGPRDDARPHRHHGRDDGQQPRHRPDDQGPDHPASALRHLPW